MVTQYKRVTLPRRNVGIDNDMHNTTKDNLIFLFTSSVDDSIKVLNDPSNCVIDSMYNFYYNLHYRGSIANRRYNIRNPITRKEVYERIKLETPSKITPHPITALGKSSIRNCIFDLSKYFEIYLFMTKELGISRKVTLFWEYFRSIFFSESTSIYQKKYVLINASLFSDYGQGNVKECLNNPLFMIYYSLYKNFDLISNINIDFVIYSGNAVLKINFSKMNNKSHSIFKRELKKILNKVSSLDNFTEDDIDRETAEDDIASSIKSRYNFVGDNDNNTVVTDITQKDESSTQTQTSARDILDIKIREKIDDAKKEIAEIVPDKSVASQDVKDFVKTKAEMDLEKDDQLAGTMYKAMQSVKVPTTPLSSARDAAMRAKQEQININNVSFAKLDQMRASNTPIPVRDISSSTHNVNKNIRAVRYTNINKSYIDNDLPRDIAKVFKSLNDKSNKLFVRDMKVEDTSDKLNYKETYRVTLEDDLKQRFTVTVDIPKFIDYKFLYLGGNKKIINKQNFLYPVVKTGPSTVQIVTNYNKMFIERIGAKSISAVERMMKLLSSNEECQKLFVVGNNTSSNKLHLTTIEYDEFGKVFTQFKTDTCFIMFNQATAIGYAEKKNIRVPKGYIFIGMKDNKPVFINSNTQLTDSGESISDLIVTELPDHLREEFNRTRSTKKLLYNIVTIMSQPISFIVLLLFWEGISSVFKKLDLKYYFSKTYPREVKNNEQVIRFNDCYFVYTEDLATSLLMNGMKVLDTENHAFEEYNTVEPFIDYFKKVYGKTSIMNAISNYYEFTIDPITKEVLEDINLPTDLIELCIYASNLLADESYTMENSQKLSRVRSTEIIPAILYYELSNAYLLYKNSARKKKISIPRDCVIKQLLSLQTVEDYSTLNPVVEMEKDRTITSKGYRGVNVDRAYTEEKRSYDETMIGTIAMSTSPDGNCGITRFLTMEPNITSTRGYVDIKNDKRDELTDMNLFSPAEMLYPLGNTRDDSVRIAMAGKQSKHVIPVRNSSPALISNGADEYARFDLSSDFVVNADEDGTVIDYDEKSNVLMVEYKSGKHRAIDLAPNIVKNGGGGFYLSNVLKTNLKVGDKFKKDQCLAYHKDFFSEDALNGVRMNVGVLEKVAIMSSYNTYNDSAGITHKMVKDCETDMTFCKSVVIGKNSNVYDIRQVGDEVEIGDPLISFDTSFEDTSLNKLLAHLSDENKEVLNEGSTNIIKSKKAGRITGIKIYSAVDLEEMSPSLQKIVSKYYARIRQKEKFVSKYDPGNTSIVKCGLLLNESTNKVEPNIYGVIKGEKVEDSILIEFYIEHADMLGVGDKIAYFTALKSVIAEVIPEGFEPYSEFRPDEEVSSTIGASAILKRQVPSILLTVLGNKVIVELKRKLEEIYNS